MRPTPKSSVAPRLFQLEAREVPATFYVDPSLAGKADGSTQTFNVGQPNQVAGLTFGSTAAVSGAVLFPTLSAALTKAEGSGGADTILLANGDIAVDNSAGAVILNDLLTVRGSGKAVTFLKPTADRPNNSTIVVEVGQSLTASDFTFDGANKSLGTAFFVDAATAKFSSVSVQNVRNGSNGGTAIAADNGSYLEVQNSAISNYDRLGVSIYNSMGSVYTTTITGPGALGGSAVTYGIQVAGATFQPVNVVGTAISGNKSAGASSEQSAGIFTYQDGGSPRLTVSTTNFFNNTYGALIGFLQGSDGSTATFTRNNFALTNTVGIVSENNTPIDARRNYWGFRNGPADVVNNPKGLGTQVDDQVDYRHWLRRPFEQGELAGNYTTAPGGGGYPGYTFNGAGGLVGTDAGVLGGFTGEIRVAAGDVNNDGVPDRIYAQGGGGSRVQVYDGKTGGLLRDFSAYIGSFSGGAYVAAGDVNGDGYADIVTGANTGGAPHVRAFDGKTGGLIRDFFAYDTSYLGGITVAVGDVNNDGFADIVTAPKTGSTLVQVFDSFYNPSTGFGRLQAFNAFTSSFSGGVFVAAGDLNGDGRADVIVGAGPTGGANVRAWASNVSGTKGSLISSFLVSGIETFTGGIRVATRDLNDDGCDDIILGMGPGGDTKNRVVYATDVGLTTPPVSVFAPWGSYPTTAGVFVG